MSCIQSPFQIQVAHFEPDSINICGEGVFPRVSMDLPRFPDEDGLYASLMKEAKENLGRDIKKKGALPGVMISTPIPSPTPRDPSQEDAKSIMSLQVSIGTVELMLIVPWTIMLLFEEFSSGLLCKVLAFVFVLCTHRVYIMSVWYKTVDEISYTGILLCSSVW